MDNLLEKGTDKQLKSEQSSWLSKKLQWELWAALINASKDVATEGSIEQMIWDIDNSKIRGIFEYYLKEKLHTKEEIKEEISIYYSEVEPMLWDAELNKLFNALVNRKKVLPSSIMMEFKIKDEILGEQDSDARELMKISLEHELFPSLILDGKDIYKKFAWVKDDESRKIILYYLESWLTARWVDERYEDYLYIKNYEYKNEELKSFILALIKNNNVDPSLVIYFFDIFKNYTKFWEEEQNYITLLINTKWL